MTKILRIVFSLTLSFGLISQPTISYGQMSDNKRFSLKTGIDAREGRKGKLSDKKTRAVQGFKNKNGSGWQARLSAKSETPRSLWGGKAVRTSGRNAQKRAENFIKANKDLLDVDVENLRYDFERKSPLGTHLYFKQVHKGLPVEHAYVKVHLDKNYSLMYYQSAYEADIDVDLNPSVGKEAAAQAAAADLGAQGAEIKNTVLVLLPTEDKGVRLAWKVTMAYYNYYIDAQNSDVLLREKTVRGLNMKTRQYPTHPNAGLALAQFEIPYLNVGYYNGGAAPLIVDTDSIGKLLPSVPLGKRLFANTTGTYFNIVNSKMVRGETSLFYVQPDKEEYFDADGRSALHARLTDDHLAPSVRDVAVRTGDIFVTDNKNNRIRKISAGIINSYAGTGVYGGVGGYDPASEGQTAVGTPLNAPTGLAISGTFLIFADTANHRVRAIETATQKIYTFAGNGTRGSSGDGGSPINAALNAPEAVEINRPLYGGIWSLFIADTGNNKVRILKGWNGTATDTSGLTIESLPGDNLNRPAGLAALLLRTGTAALAREVLFVSDTANHALVYYILNGNKDVVAGPMLLAGQTGSAGNTDGPAAGARFNSPAGLAISPLNSSDPYAGTADLYVADTRNNSIRKIKLTIDTFTGVVTPGAVSTVVNTSGNAGFSGDGGKPADAQINGPKGVDFNDGYLYIADTGNNRVRIVRNLDTSAAAIETLAGGGPGFVRGGNFGALPESVRQSIDSGHPYPESAASARIAVDNKTFGRAFTCSTPLYKPAFVAPYFANENATADNFSIGLMDAEGAILQKDTLNVLLDGINSSPLAKYIGAAKEFLGPVMFASNTSAASLIIVAGKGNAGTRKWGYRVSEKHGYCIPEDVLGYTDPAETLSWGDRTPEMNAYINMNAMRDFLNEATLNNNNSFIPLNVLADRTTPDPLSVMVNVSVTNAQNENGLMNAFYDPEINAVYLGEGRFDGITNSYVNTALESAIVRHEYIHYMIERLWPLFNYGEGGAISEALADFFALSSIRNTGSDEAITSIIGEYAELGGERNIANKLYYNSYDWAGRGQYENSLVVSSLLWSLRTGTAPMTINNVDRLVFYSLFFFPDTLLELRESMESACAALGANCDVAAVTAAFDEFNIKASSEYDDAYEPNNGPVDAYGLLYGQNKITAKLSPEDDWDFYAVTLPKDKMAKFTLTMPQKDGAQPVRYFPMGMVLLNDQYKIVEKFHQAGPESTGLTPTKTITIEHTPLAPVSGPYTGRVILGIFRPEDAQYSEGKDYTLEVTYAQPNPIERETLPGRDSYRLSAPYTIIPQSISMPAVLSGGPLQQYTDTATTTKLDRLYRVRLLDDNKKPIAGADGVKAAPGATTISNPYFMWTDEGDLAQNSFGRITIDAVALRVPFPNISTVYVELIGATRAGANTNETDPLSNPANQTNDFSYGLTDMILLSTAVGSGQTHMRNTIFNPNRGEAATLIINPPETGRVTAKIYSRGGLLVRELFDGDVPRKAAITSLWDGKNDGGSVVASGIYVLIVNGPGIDIKQKIAVVK